jgi:hypothetical protein
MTVQRFADEAFWQQAATVLAEEELDRVAHAVDGAVEIHPAAAHPDISFHQRATCPVTGRFLR